jgi:hypothetical protein
VIVFCCCFLSATVIIAYNDATADFSAVMFDAASINQIFNTTVYKRITCIEKKQHSSNPVELEGWHYPGLNDAVYKLPSDGKGGYVKNFSCVLQLKDYRLVEGYKTFEVGEMPFHLYFRLQFSLSSYLLLRISCAPSYCRCCCCCCCCCPSPLPSS